MSAAAHDLSELDKDPRLFLYTSLTAGSSHIITATSRVETILKANRIPFLAVDVATDEKARRLWGRRAGKRKLPGLVKEGYVLGDLEQIEEWNEFGELKENIGPVPPVGTTPAPSLPVKPNATAGAATSKIPPAKPLLDDTKMRPLPGAAEIAAKNNLLPKSSPEQSAAPETMASAPADKEKSIHNAKTQAKIDHLSAPPSAIPSGTATPKDTGSDTVQIAGQSKVDHLSAPPSAIPSGAVSPAGQDGEAPLSNDQAAAAVANTGSGVESRKSDTHRGSDVVAAPEDEVKRVESENAIPEAAEEEGSESAAKGVQDLQLGDGKTVSEQAAKEPEDATKSVED